MFNGSREQGAGMANQSRCDTVDIWEEHFASNHLLMLSLVRQNRTKGYQKSIFAFLKGAPAGKGGNGGKTYLVEKQHSISFKLELLQLVALGKAFEMYAKGVGKKITSKHQVWADPSKSEFGAEDGQDRAGKSFTIRDELDRSRGAAEGDRIIVVAFNRGKEKSGSSQYGVGQRQSGQQPSTDSFTVTFKPFEALAIADAIEHMAALARSLLVKEREQAYSEPATNNWHADERARTENAQSQNAGNASSPSSTFPTDPQRSPFPSEKRYVA